MAKETNIKESFGRFDFMGTAWIWGGISILTLIVAIVVLMVKEINYGIDFAGGTEVQVKFVQPVEAAKVREFTSKIGLMNASVQAFGTENEFLIRFETTHGATDKETNEIISAQVKKVVEGLTASFAAETPTIRRVDSVGPQVGAELKRDSLLASFYCLLVILIYVGLRFDFRYSPGAVLCLAHDALIVFALYVFLGKEVNVQILAAILTLIGYSINDTIVNFDRIRETIPKHRDKPLAWVINKSVNDMLFRTIMTSVATLLSTTALFIFAGGVISDFAFTFGVGIIFGTYSSIFVSNPLIIVMDYILNSFKVKNA